MNSIPTITTLILLFVRFCGNKNSKVSLSLSLRQMTLLLPFYFMMRFEALLCGVFWCACVWLLFMIYELTHMWLEIFDCEWNGGGCKMSHICKINLLILRWHKLISFYCGNFCELFFIFNFFLLKRFVIKMFYVPNGNFRTTIIFFFALIIVLKLLSY